MDLLLVGLTGLLLGGALGFMLARRRVPRETGTQPAPQIAEDRQQAVVAERERIYADLHDDIGAKLLNLVYQAPKPEYADLARSVLQDLRDVVSRSRGEPASLLELLGQLHAEASRRLDAVGIRIDWQQPDDLPDAPLDQAQNLHLARILREGISNVIQHSGAGALRVRLKPQPDALLIELADDGAGLRAAGRPGRGLDNMRQRAAAVEGDIDWSASTAGGTRVVLRLPLRAT